MTVTEPALPCERREDYVAWTLATDVEEIESLSYEDCRYLFMTSKVSLAEKQADDLRLQSTLVLAGELRGARTPAILGGWGLTITWRNGITVRRFQAEGP